MIKERFSKEIKQESSVFKTDSEASDSETKTSTTPVTNQTVLGKVI